MKNGRMTDLLNQIIVGVLGAEWELSTIVNCYKEKGDSLEKENYRGLELTDQILKIADRIIEKFMRQQVDIDEIQFGFMPGCKTRNAVFILRQLERRDIWQKKKNLCYLFVDLEKGFHRVPINVVW